MRILVYLNTTKRPCYILSVNTLSLGTLNLSYEFNEDLCKKLYLRTLRAGVNFTDLFRLSTVKIERGTSYLYSKGFEVYVSATF